MNRQNRTLLVVLVAVLVASGASYAVYRAVQARPVREVEVAHAFAVVAARPLPVGIMVTAADVTLVPWPARNPVAGGFTAVEQVVSRGLISAVETNEPLTESKLAPAGAGAGLPPTIPQGMRAISVRVNEVIGVAGFVTPGTRVDVIVIMQDGEDSLARVVVSGVQVLTAGTRFEQDAEAEGQAMPSTVVTLMVTPEDAQKIGLASSDGQIILTLRNPLDVTPTAAVTTRRAALLGEPAPRPATVPAPAPRPVVRSTPPPPPAPPPVYTVETIRAAKRSEETVR